MSMKKYKYKSYPKYKDSSIEWLGEIPEHWEVKRLKYVNSKNYDLAQTGPFGSQLHASDYVDEGVPFILIKNIQNLKFDKVDIPMISYKDANRLKNYKVLEGDIVFSRVGSVGRIVVVSKEEEGWIISGQTLRLRLRGHLNMSYIVFTLNSKIIENEISYRSVGSTRESINTEILVNIPIPLPPLAEQKEIADFLDKETAKIDQLISLQEKLIALLQEKRQALISQAVTKGIPGRQRKMKDSGIEWLGEIPEEWEVNKLKRLIKKIGSGITPRGGSEIYLSEGVPLIRSQNIFNEYLKFDDVVFISDKIHKNMINSKVLENDILLNITGASIGRCNIYDGSLGEANVNQHVCIIRTIDVAQKYIYFFIISSLGQKQIDFFQSGANREGLNFEQIKNFRIPLPPLSEQKEIAEFLDKETAKIDLLIEKAKKSIALSKEKRQALISAAVTGKIDVREFPPSPRETGS